jgi:hypothetical protein
VAGASHKLNAISILQMLCEANLIFSIILLNFTYLSRAVIFTMG